MMFINNYCTGFMFQEVIVCNMFTFNVIIFNFLLIFKISQKFVEFYVYMFKLRNFFRNSNKMSYI